MRVYFIKTFKSEDREDMVKAYPYSEYLEVKQSLDEVGIRYETWIEEWL